MKWEYHVTSLEGEEHLKKLADLGRREWELIAVTVQHGIVWGWLKRPLERTETPK